MKAAVWHGRGDVRVDEIGPPSSPGATEALVEVSRCGLCGSDRREFDAGPVLIPRRAHPLSGQRPPIVLGHEIAGSVVAVGIDGDDSLVGRRVAIDPTLACGRCTACQRGDRHLCSVAACLGVSAPGGLARFVLAPVAGLVELPEVVSDDEGALAEPVAVALHAVDRAQIRLGERVVVFGAGPIGAAVVLVCRAAGAGEIFVVEPAAARRAMAIRVGADAAIEPGGPENPSDDLRTLRGSVDAGFECSGAAGALDAAVRSTRPGGRVVVAAIHRGSVPLSANQLVLGERSLIGTVGYSGDIARAIRLMASGAIDARVLVDRVLSIDQVPAWFATPALAAVGLKALVDPAR